MREREKARERKCWREREREGERGREREGKRGGEGEREKDEETGSPRNRLTFLSNLTSKVLP